MASQLDPSCFIRVDTATWSCVLCSLISWNGCNCFSVWFLSVCLSALWIPGLEWHLFSDPSYRCALSYPRFTLYDPLLVLYMSFKSRNGSTMSGLVPSPARGTASKRAPSWWPSMSSRLVRLYQCRSAVMFSADRKIHWAQFELGWCLCFPSSDDISFYLLLFFNL